jgi:hypothetical protein
MKVEEKEIWKKLFRHVIAYAREHGLIDETYSGQFTLNVANGGLSDCEKKERIK